MANTKYATLANFNCTFKINSETYPMLNYFEKIIWPAFNDKTLIRKTYKRNDKKLPIRYHISDVKIVELDNGNNLALIGKHIKRTILEISEDYKPDKGFIGESETKPSAPYSTFIILLNNHRVIYFPNKAGAPDIRSFASTTRSIIDQYINNQRDILLNKLDKKEYPAKEAAIYIKNEYPTAELNIVAIESEELAIEAFKNIFSIRDVKFKFYKTNNDPIDFDSVFESAYKLIDQTNSNSMEQKFNSPKEISVIETAVIKSKGKTNYKINAVNINKESIIITPDKISPKIEIFVDDNISIEKNISYVYNQLKERKEIRSISEDNKNIFNKFKNLIFSLKK